MSAAFSNFPNGAKSRNHVRLLMLFACLVGLLVVGSLAISPNIAGVSAQILVASPTPLPTIPRGVVGDLWADKELGQKSFSEVMPYTTVDNKLAQPLGAIVFSDPNS